MDKQPKRTVSGLQLQRAINRITGKQTFASTILGYLRDYADASASELICIDGQKSLYSFVPGYKIFGSLGGKE